MSFKNEELQSSIAQAFVRHIVDEAISNILTNNFEDPKSFQSEDNSNLAQESSIDISFARCSDFDFESHQLSTEVDEIKVQEITKEGTNSQHEVQDNKHIEQGIIRNIVEALLLAT